MITPIGGVRVSTWPRPRAGPGTPWRHYVNLASSG